MNRCLPLTAALLVFHGGAAWSCGGAWYFVPSLQPAATTLATDAYDGTDIAPFRFLDPFRLAGLHQGERLAQIAYAGADPAALDPVAPGVPPKPAPPEPVPPDPAALDLALEAADRAGARTAALAIVDAVLSLPAPLAAGSGDALRRAVELLEVEPALADAELPRLAEPGATAPAEGGGTPLDQTVAIRAASFAEAASTLARFPMSPRRPSMELAVLRNRMTTEIGNGWPGQIQDTSPGTWADLLAAHDDWLARHPDHPLVDLARLQKLRLLYLQGDAAAAWALLLDLYPRRPARALWEMRHLLLNGMAPTGLDLAGLPDPVLATALLGLTPPPSRAQWSVLWQRAEAAAGAPWAVNLQERLLLAAAQADAGPLPDAFPAQAARPSELWGQLRALALLRAGRHADALQQAELLDGAQDPRSAAILATALVQVGQTTRAAALPALDAETAAYLLQVIADDEPLAAMARGGGLRAEVAAEALAARRLGDGDWAAGAKALAAADPARAARWREAFRRARDRGAAGQLALARWLLEHRGELFLHHDSGTYRGLKGLLDTDLPPTQRARLVDRLLRAGEEERALEAYGAALAALDPRRPESAEVLREADRLYNRLLNWDVSGSASFEALLAASPAARRIRAAGKQIRAAQVAP